MSEGMESVVVLGASGFVGSRLLQLWADKFTLIAPSHAELDLLDQTATRQFLERTDAQLVVNLAAWADVDGAEVERGNTTGRVYALNASYPTRLAALCADFNKHLVHVSTDYVFGGGQATRPYTEADPTEPLCWYAATKLLGEQGVLNSGASACVARIEMPFSGQDYPKRDFARICQIRLESGQAIMGVTDQHITPVFLDDAVAGLRLLAEARTTGVVHVAAADWTTPFRFARSIARRLKLDLDLVQETTFDAFTATRPARRPQHSWLDVSLFGKLFGSAILRPVEAELDGWLAQLQTASGRS
jgi:dTDP-4-dehydrorhamnose reductase